MLLLVCHFILDLATFENAQTDDGPFHSDSELHGIHHSQEELGNNDM